MRRFGLKSLARFDKFQVVLHLEFDKEVTINGIDRPNMERLNRDIFRKKGMYVGNDGHAFVDLSKVVCHTVSPEQTWTEDML